MFIFKYCHMKKADLYLRAELKTDLQISCFYLGISHNSLEMILGRLSVGFSMGFEFGIVLQNWLSSKDSLTHYLNQ